MGAKFPEPIPEHLKLKAGELPRVSPPPPPKKAEVVELRVVGEQTTTHTTPLPQNRYTVCGATKQEGQHVYCCHLPAGHQRPHQSFYLDGLQWETEDEGALHPRNWKEDPPLVFDEANLPRLPPEVLTLGPSLSVRPVRSEVPTPKAGCFGQAILLLLLTVLFSMGIWHSRDEPQRELASARDFRPNPDLENPFRLLPRIPDWGVLEPVRAAKDLLLMAARDAYSRNWEWAWYDIVDAIACIVTWTTVPAYC